MVPPEAFHVTVTATLSPALVRPKAANCTLCEGSRVTLLGETMILGPCRTLLSARSGAGRSEQKRMSTALSRIAALQTRIALI
jgi:hypothetical protein